mgnify:FL=1
MVTKNDTEAEDQTDKERKEPKNEKEFRGKESTRPTEEPHVLA